MSISASNSSLRAALPAAKTALRTDNNPKGHVVQLYTDDCFLIESLRRFISGALAAGDVVVVLATQTHLSELESKLTVQGFDLAGLSSQRRYFRLDAEQALRAIMREDSLDEISFDGVIGSTVRLASKTAPGRLAIFGELVALLWAQGKEKEAVRVEELWNGLASEHAFSLLCAYPITGFGREGHVESFLAICDLHNQVFPTERYTQLATEQERLRAVPEFEQKNQVLQKQNASKQSEHQFRLFVDAVQDYAIFMLDPDGNVITWNQGAQRIKGYKASEIIGRHFSTFYPEEDMRAGKPRWELEVAAREGRFEDEGWRLRKDGSKFWANVIITALRNSSGKLVAFGKVTRDFTERMQAHQALEREIAEKRQTERQLQNSEKSLRELSLHLFRTQDEERRRIGRDLHDSLGQYLAVLKMKLDSVAALLREQPETAAQDLVHCMSLTESSIREVRTMSYLLYPPMLEELGLKSAIPWYLEGFSDRSGIRTSLEIQADLDRPSRESELALFRILQESLTNVHRHSGSETAHVRLFTRGGMCILEVVDQGRGIAPELLDQADQDISIALGVGLRGMSERVRHLGGNLELMSSKSGTTVRATVPTKEPATGT